MTLLTWNKEPARYFSNKDSGSAENCNSGPATMASNMQVPCTQGKETLYREEKEVGRAIVNKEIMAFYWLSPWQERRWVFLLPVGLCYHCRAWGLSLLVSQLYFSKYLYWSIIAIQCCVSICCITKWISYTYTCIPISPPSCISLPSSLSHPSRWSQSTELISLCYAAASH